MKVLFVINSSNNGGAMKMIVTLYREMKKYHPLSKIVFLKKIESQYSNIDEAYYLSNRLTTPLDYFSVYHKLKKVISNERPDAIISFLPLANIFSSIIGRNLNVKIRVASQRNPPQTYGKTMQLIDRFIGSRNYYTANVCNSEAGMAAFESYPQSYKKLLSVIHNCVEPADFTISADESKAILKLPNDKVIMTCVGRLHDQKNHELLVKAMKHIDNAILYCAGDGPLRERIVSLIKQEGVENKIVLLGDLERAQVRQLLRASDLFVIPSKYEGLSNSLIEAMSYGLPIVFSNIPSFTSFMKISDSEHYAGLLIKSAEENVWAEKITKLIGDKNQMEQYRKMSFDKVASLTSEKMTLRFMELLN